MEFLIHALPSKSWTPMVYLCGSAGRNGAGAQTRIRAASA